MDIDNIIKVDGKLIESSEVNIDELIIQKNHILSEIENKNKIITELLAEIDTLNLVIQKIDILLDK